MISALLRQGADNGYFMASKFTIDREWLDLPELAQYAAVSDRTLRAWLHRVTDALPAVRVGGKILVRRSEFDAWLERHRISLGTKIDVDDIVNGVLIDID
jgi:excisionase family DNA binding protein